MTERWAVASSTWSNPATWNGGTLPASGDDVYANGFTVTIDQNIVANSLRVIAGTTAVVGGGFTSAMTGTIDLVSLAMGAFTGAVNTPLLTFTGGAITLTVTNPITGDSSTTGQEPFTLRITGGTHIVNGDVVGGSATSTTTAEFTGSGTQVTMYGDVTGGSASSGIGVSLVNSVRATIVGDIRAGSGASAHGVSRGTTNIVLRVDGFVIVEPDRYPALNFSPMFVVGSAGGYRVITDSAWPATSGSTVDLVEDSGGGVDPLRYLNVGGVAVPIQ